MQELCLPVYRPWADLSALGIKWFMPWFNLAASYNRAKKIFNDLPVTQKEVYLKMDKLIYLNNTPKWKNFRDSLLVGLKWNIDENLLDIKKRNFTTLDIINSLKDRYNTENNLFILKEFSAYLSNEIYDFLENIYSYSEVKNSNNFLNKEAAVTLEDYCSAIYEISQIILSLEVIKISEALWIKDLNSIIENTEEQVDLVINQ